MAAQPGYTAGAPLAADAGQAFRGGAFMPFDLLSLALGFAGALFPLLGLLWMVQRRLTHAQQEVALLQERLEHAQLSQAGMLAQLDDCRSELAEISEIKVEQQSELAALRRE